MDMNQNFGGFYGQPMATGYQWNGMQPQSKRMNVLTADEIQQLMKVENKFSLALTATEKMKAACTHMKADGSGDALVQNNDGTCTCAICGYTFKPLDPATASEEFLQAAVDTIVDILQTIKLTWIDADANTVREYYQILPLIEKIPKLYEIAAKNFANHENSNAWGYAANRGMGTLQMFGLLSGILNGAGQPSGVQFGQPAYQQPMYQQPMGFAQQPMMGGMPQGNPFGSVNPAQYQAQTSGFAYDPTQVQPQVVDPNAQTQQPVVEQTVTDGAETTTTATFKA